MSTTFGRTSRDSASTSGCAAILVAGIASPHGDDRVGWAVVERLRPLVPESLTIRAVNGGLDLLACLEGQDAAIVVDAAEPRGQPGRVQVFDWPCPDLVECRPLSTHGPGLVEALHLAAVLGRLPRRVRIYTVEAEAAEPGTVVGSMAANSVDAVTAAVLGELKDVARTLDDNRGAGDA
jgi:hydrogenase maturation protease